MDIASLPVTSLKGVGPKLAEKLARLDLRSVQDVLFHLPFRYQDRTRVLPIGRLRPGMEAMIAGEIELADIVYRGRRSLVVRLGGGTGHIHLRFFHFNAAQQNQLQRGKHLRCFGAARFGPVGLEMAHPEYELVDAAASVKAEEHLTPVYPATTGVHQLSLRKLARQATEKYLAEIREWLPHHLSLRRLRAQMQRHVAPVLAGDGRLMHDLLARLPFRLTRAQQLVLAEIVHDMGQGHPMQRLVQGDVGSGKTVVAACAGLRAVEAGLQVAVMAPTELLADQHLRNFSAWLEPLGVAVAGLSGKLNGRARRAVLEEIGSGKSAIAVGTQALFQEGVEFADLGLVVVDEQHRFGVHQRLALREKGAAGARRPHQLIMTATPIPRTLAQALDADLDVSG